MAEHANTSKVLESYARPRQDWGGILGVGIVLLLMAVLVVNLFARKDAIPFARLYEDVTLPPGWVQTGRWIAVLAGLGGGAWGLRRLFDQRQPTQHASLRSSLQQAIAYIEQIELLLKTGADEPQQHLLVQIQTWQHTIEVMVQTLADLAHNDHMITRDLQHLPEAITGLERQLAIETQALLRDELRQMLLQRKRQQQALEQLQITRRRAEIQLERASAVLGTIYSQLLTYRSTFHVADYQHLADNVAEEVLHLQDYLEALHDWRPGDYF